PRGGEDGGRDRVVGGPPPPGFWGPRGWGVEHAGGVAAGGEAQRRPPPPAQPHHPPLFGVGDPQPLPTGGAVLPLGRQHPLLRHPSRPAAASSPPRTLLLSPPPLPPPPFRPSPAHPPPSNPLLRPRFFLPGHPLQ